MEHKRFSEEERRLIYTWRKEGLSLGAIGKLLKRDKGAISREIRRNSGGRGYRYQQAQRQAEERARRGGHRTFTEAMRQEIEMCIRKKRYTPEMITGRARREGRRMVGRERIYQYIYADAKADGDLWTYLPRAKRRRRRRCPRLDSRGRGQIPNQRRIDERPALIDKRERIGDWEGDLIQGAKASGHMVTLVDRASRFTLVGKVPTKEADTVEDRITVLFRKVPVKARYSLTVDNGKEFTNHKAIASRNGIDVYFAHPYHSWERGTNENTNGLIRQLIAKKTSFKAIGARELRMLDRYLNDRPKKCLGWRTPREVFWEKLRECG